MTYWYENPDNDKDAWHWMGLASSLAIKIGLQVDPKSTDMPLSQQKMRKRIWWCCYMRDRVIALGTRHPMNFEDRQFDMPMLEEEDFDIRQLDDNIAAVSTECTFMRDTQMQKELATMCIAMASLCTLIGRVLESRYSVHLRQNLKLDSSTNQSTMMFCPDKTLKDIHRFNKVDTDLTAWLSSLPDCCHRRPLTTTDVVNGKSTIVVHRQLLHMMYFGAVSALHRPGIPPSTVSHEQTTRTEMQSRSRVKVREAATHVTDIIVELHHYHLDGYLPTTGVTVILPTMVSHILEMKSNSEEARDRATHSLLQCALVMDTLSQTYISANYALSFLEAAMHKATPSIDIKKMLSKPAVVGCVPVKVDAQVVPQLEGHLLDGIDSEPQRSERTLDTKCIMPSNVVDAIDLGMTDNITHCTMSSGDNFDWMADVSDYLDVEHWLRRSVDSAHQEELATVSDVDDEATAILAACFAGGT